MGVSFAYGGAKEPQAINTIHAAMDMGVAFLDSAEMYGPFDNEVLAGKAIKGIRDKVQIATKFSFRILPTGQGLECMADVDSRLEHIYESVEGSLKRLDIETINLLYQHRVDPAVPVEDVMDTTTDLVKEEKIRHIGLLEVSAQTLRRACKMHPIIAVQTEYSLWTREPEVGVLSACRELGVGFAPYNPPGRGFLTRKITDPGVLAEDDFRHNPPCFQAETTRRNQLLLKHLQQVVTCYDATPMQIALAWVINKDGDIVPVPGARKITHLHDDAGAASITFSPEDILTIEDIFTFDSATGLCYNQGDFNLIEK